MDSLSISVLCLIPYAIATHIRGSNASRSSSQTKPQPEKEFGYPQTHFGPPCQEPDFVPISKDIAPSATYALPPPSVSEPDFLETCKTLVKKLAEHLTPERIRAIVLEFKRMVDRALPIEVILARLSTLLADKPNLLRSLELLALGNHLLVTIHPHRTYLTVLSDGPHAVSWSLVPTKVRTPPTAPPIPGPTVTLPHLSPAPHLASHRAAPQVRTSIPSSRLPPLQLRPHHRLSGAATCPTHTQAAGSDLSSRTPGPPSACPSAAPSRHAPRTQAPRRRQPFAPNQNPHASLYVKTKTKTKTTTEEDCDWAPAGFVGLAFGSLNGPADVRRAGALLLDDPDLLRGLAEFVDGEGARGAREGDRALGDARGGEATVVAISGEALAIGSSQRRKGSMP